MNIYKIVVSDNFDNRIYNAQFKAISKKEAVTMCLDIYAMELDCLAEDLTILEVKKVEQKTK